MNQDNRLFAQISEGRKAANQAFFALDTKYRLTMHVILLKQYSIYDASTREDIIQDTFVSVFTKHKCYRGDSSFFTWIIMILKNTASSYFRKQRVINNTEQDIAMFLLPTSDKFTEIDEFDCEKQALEAFRKDNCNRYSQLMQVIWNGLTLKELADLEQISYSTARKRISLLRKELIAYIELHCGKIIK